MKQLVAVMTMLLIAACSPAAVSTDTTEVAEQPEVAPEVSNDELEGIDDIDAILSELDDLDLDLDDELSALDEDLQ